MAAANLPVVSESSQDICAYSLNRAGSWLSPLIWLRIFATVRKSTNARRTAILDRLSRAGFVQVADLRRDLACSEATIRRDLQQLELDGYLQRTHGGAVSDGERELPVTSKVSRMADAKQRIAAAAAELIPEAEQAVGFTGGTTTQYVARRLAGRSGLIVVTNAINVVTELVDADIRVVVVGGELRRPSWELVGPLGEPAASQLHLDVMFTGVDGISVAGGLTTFNALEARTNQVLIERSSRVIVVADHTKLGRATFAQIAPIDVVDTVVTDSGADPAELDALRAAGVSVVVS
jgi:DeoR family transcriptional regulator of aga operon